MFRLLFATPPASYPFIQRRPEVAARAANGPPIRYQAHCGTCAEDAGKSLERFIQALEKKKAKTP